MSVSYFIKAYTSENNTEYQKHKEVLEFCRKMKVSLPYETAMYFSERSDVDLEYGNADEALEIELKEDEHYSEYRDEYYWGYEIDLNKLPIGVTKLRFLIG